MAETKNSAPVKTGLPEKEWFTLEQMAARWTRLTGQTFTERDLLDFGDNELLKIGFLFDHTDDELSLIRPPESTTAKFAMGLAVSAAQGRIYAGDVAIIDKSDIRRIIKHGKTTPIHVWKFTHISDGDGAFVSYKFPNSEEVEINNLVITRAERDRFEQEHGINQIGMTAEETLKPHEPETGTKRTKLEKQIAAILDAAKCKKYDPMKIPDGGKTLLATIVRDDPDTEALFKADSAFQTAWKAARRRKLVKMENYDSFAKSNR